MRWKNEIARAGYHSMATDQWDKKTLKFVEALGDHLEAGDDYHEFRPEEHLDFTIQPDQIGQGLVILFSEWAEDADELIMKDMSGLETALLVAHIQAYIDFQREMAAQAPHLGEADERLEDSDSS